MKLLLVCLTIPLLAMPRIAGATMEIWSGENLRDTCESSEELTKCFTYLEVVYQTAKAIARTDDARADGVVGSCGPEKGLDTLPLVISLRDAWQQYAAKYPERLRYRAAGEALRSFEERWPCQR